MKICMPVEQLNGLDSAIAASFRAATKLVVVDSQTMECLSIDASDGSCSAVPPQIDAIIFSEGIGRGMFNGLKQNGIRVFASQASSVRSALVEFATGQMQEVHQVACCGGGSHHEDESAGCGCGGHDASASHGHGGCCGSH